jgi:hypothetical protein
MKDVLAHGCGRIAETAVLGMGRYFRVNEHTYILIGRDEIENEKLVASSIPGDVVFRSFVFPGPAALLRSTKPREEDLVLAAGLIQYYSKFRGEDGLPVSYWKSEAPDEVCEVSAQVLDEEMVGVLMR